MFRAEMVEIFLFLFIYLITLGKDITFPLITIFKTNRSLSYLFVNRIPTSANSMILCSHHVLSDYILERTQTSLCKQICKQPDFLAYGADLIDRRET